MSSPLFQIKTPVIRGFLFIYHPMIRILSCLFIFLPYLLPAMALPTQPPPGDFDSSLAQAGHIPGLTSFTFPALQTGAANAPTLPLHPLSFEYNGFASFPTYCNHLLFVPADTPPIRKDAFTNMKFAMGGKREQLFSLYHLQQFSGRLTLETKITGNRGDGFYKNQMSRFSQVAGKLGYKSVSGRFSSALYWNFFSHYQRLNGGVPDSVDYPTGSSRAVYEVNIPQAFSRVRSNSMEWEGRWQLWKRDSLQTSRCVVFYRAGLMEAVRSYNDSLNATAYVFPENIYDTVKTADFLFHQLIENRTGIEFLSTKHLLSADVSLPMNYLSNPIFGNHFSSFVLHGKYVYCAPLLAVTADASQYLGGWNNGDHNQTFMLDFPFNFWKVNFEAKNARVTPSLYFSRYASNHYNYSYDFSSQNMQHLILRCSSRLGNLQAGFHRLDRLVLPLAEGFMQFSSSNTFFWAMADFQKKWKHAQVGGKFLYQNCNGPMRNNIPRFFSSLLLAAGGKLFSGSLSVLAGSEVYVTSAYSGWGYSPALGVFTRVTDNKSLQNYPVASFFLNCKASSLIWYLRADNILYPITGQTYYTVTGYPMQDLMIRFGISWNFYDLPFQTKK